MRQGKSVVLIAGALTGIGRATALAFVKDGGTSSRLAGAPVSARTSLIRIMLEAFKTSCKRALPARDRSRRVVLRRSSCFSVRTTETDGVED
jgi:NAD(P)-dependent dehydrogenase (short-subunit alcohol dehydrogenase family)